MQLIVLALTIPWLLMIARHSRAYMVVRIVGAAFAGVASLAWIAERTAVLHTRIPEYVERVASHAPFVLGALALTALALEVGRLRAKSAVSASAIHVPGGES